MIKFNFWPSLALKKNCGSEFRATLTFFKIQRLPWIHSQTFSKLNERINFEILTAWKICLCFFFSTGHTVAMVTWYVMKVTRTFLFLRQKQLTQSSSYRWSPINQTYKVLKMLELKLLEEANFSHAQCYVSPYLVFVPVTSLKWTLWLGNHLTLAVQTQTTGSECYAMGTIHTIGTTVLGINDHTWTAEIHNSTK